ncbi:MAG: YitT family protein [Calditrichia bacterium]
MEDKRYDLKCLIRDLLYILLGSVTLSLGLTWFLVPNKIATGGVAGLSIVLHHLINTPTGLTMLVLNIPLLLLGWKNLGKSFLFRTLFAMVSFSFFTDFFAVNLKLSALTDNLLLATLYGGVMVGAGLGLVFKGDASAGGGTIIAKILSRNTRFKTGQVLFAIDILVISSAAISFKNIELALWGFITIFIASQLIDVILTGKPFAKVIHLITEHPAEIGEHIINDLGRSATIVKSKGLYSGLEKNLLIVVVDSSQIYRLRDIVRLHDPNAFMIVMNAHEILGQGF